MVKCFIAKLNEMIELVCFFPLFVKARALLFKELYFYSQLQLVL